MTCERVILLLFAISGPLVAPLHGQEADRARATLGPPPGSFPAPRSADDAIKRGPASPLADFLPPVPPAEDRPLPINLSSALQLAGVSPLDIALATQRLQLANA